MNEAGHKQTHFYFEPNAAGGFTRAFFKPAAAESDAAEEPCSLFWFLELTSSFINT